MYSINVLEEFLRQFNCMDGLLEIGKVSRKLFSDNKFQDNLPVIVNNNERLLTVTQWGLAHLAYRLILVSNDGKRKKLDWNKLTIAHSIFNDLNDPFQNDNDLIGFLFRSSQEQFWWQDINLPSLWSRYKCIFSYDNFFTNNFYNISELSVEEYLLIGISILGYANLALSTPVFSIKNLMSSSIPSPFKESLTEEKINLFLKLTSGNYQKIRSEARTINKLTIPKYERFEFNSLFKYPIVQGDSRFQYYSSFQYVIPNLGLLMKKVAQGAYWDLRDYFAGNPSPSQDFLNKFGEAFESYCGKILENHFNDKNVQRLEDVLDKQYKNTNISDWVILDNEAIYIFECKSSLLPLMARQTFIKSVLNRWITRNIIKAIKQLEDTVSSLRKVGLITKQKVYKFIILLEDLHFAESHDFKKPIIERMIEKNILTSNQVYFITITELERMEEAIKKHGFIRILEKKKEIDDTDKLTLGSDFISVCKELDNSLNIKSQFLSRIFKETFSDWEIFK